MAQCSNVRVLEQEGQLQNRIFHSSHRSSNIGAKPICTAERKGRPNEIIALTLASWIAKLSLAFPILWKRERGVGLSREKKGIWLGKGGGGHRAALHVVLLAADVPTAHAPHKTSSRPFSRDGGKQIHARECRGYVGDCNVLPLT